MDKRTILFVLCLGLAFFGINWYFEGQNQEKLKQWSEQQKAKNLQIQQKLERDIAQRGVDVSALPIINIYADEKATEFITSGIEVKGSILTLAWKKNPPEIVFVRKSHETGATESAKLLFSESQIDQPVAYVVGQAQKLQAGSLPDFGSFDLQLVEPIAKSTEPHVLLGEYKDGHLTIPALQLAKLKNDRQEPELRHEIQLPSNAIALLKTSSGYLPVGIYERSTNSIKLMDEFQSSQDFVSHPEVKQAVTSAQKPEEKFYVLENSYQQMVFSNYGGALVEINLPFQNDKNKLSVVKEIEYDREMVKDHPYNAYFPAHAYYTPGMNLHSKGSLGGYYPLLRRDLIEKGGTQKSIRIQPKFYATNIISEYPELADLVYEVKKFDQNTIVFEASQSHRKITKTYTLKNDAETAPYTFELNVNVDGDSKGLWLTSGIPEVEWISGGIAPALKYRITRNQKAYVENIDLPKDAVTVSSVNPDWIVDSNGFFGVILDPLSKIDSGYRVQEVSGTIVPSRLIELSQYDRFKSANLPGYMTLLPLANEGGSMEFRIFSGPFAETILKKVDSIYSNPETGYNPDYIASQTFHGWFAFISEPFAKFLFILMKFFYQITGSWAFSIILLTVALRVMMYPLNAWSTKSMLRMQQIAPEVTAIQEKYKKDPKKAQLEIMALYRERGVNPISGCFPLLIQMPFLIGMFDLLKSTFELRGASFIPGWIDDLAAPDVLFSWNTPIFFIGNQFHLLPILLGAVMFLQQRYMSTAPQDPKLMTDAQRQQRSMGTIMTLVFTVMFYNFPSGLNIYWLSSMLLGMLQQWWTTKQMQKKMTQPQVIGVPQKKGKVKG